MMDRAIFLSLVGIFLAARLSAVLLPVGAAEPTPIMVCYPGGAVDENDARGAMDAMLRVLERLGGWPEKSFTSFFTAEPGDCKKLMGEKQPAFAITSLGLYLELRAEHHLIPLAQPRINGSNTERTRVVVREGRYKDLADLEGKSLGGTVLAEPEFVSRIVFAGKYAPASFFVLKPSKHAIRALRALDKGELDAVILNGQQFAGLGSLHLSNPIEAIFTSEEIPLMGVVANDRTGSAVDRARFARALEGLCADSEGKKLCQLFGVESFATVDPVVFEPMIELWDGESKPLRGAAFLFAAALGLVAGCSTLDGVRFGRLSSCPEEIVEILTVRPSELGPWSETDTLECALSWLQDTDDPTLRRSALGSRLSLHLAERTPEADQRENLAAEGVRFAETAIALGADGDGAVHYYLAANLGLVIRDHVTLAMENLPRLQGEMQRAVDLSPEIDDGGPLRLLGILYLKAPPWPTGFGDGEKALGLLEQAVEKHPEHPLNRLFYAEVLWEADESSPVERIETQLATGMRCLAEGNWGYNRAPWKKEFDRFLEDIGGSAR